MHLRRIRSGWLLFWLAALAAAGAQEPSREYQVKAAFLYNFARFVDWPSTVFTNSAQPFQIGILGENPFGTSLDEMVAGETIKKRKVVIRRATEPQSLADCQVVYLPKSEAKRAAEIHAEFRTRPVLTVGENDGGGREMAIINFYRDGPKVRFEINRDAAEAARLKLSSELLSLGKPILSQR